MKKNENVLLFSTYFWPYVSGALSYPVQILEEYSRITSAKVRVLTFKYDSVLKTSEVYKGFEVQRAGFWFRASKGFIALGYSLRSLSQVLWADTVVLNIPNFEGFELALLARLLGKRVVGIYNCEVVLTGGFAARWVNLILNASVHLQLKCCHKVIAYTDDYAQSSALLRPYLGKMTTLFPQVQDRPLKRVTAMSLMKEKGTEIWIGFSGRVAAEKGLMKLARALIRFRKRNPDKQFRLILVGPYGDSVVGEKQTYLNLLEFLEANQIPHRFYGNQDPADLPAFYTMMDVLVLPSTNRTEAFGLVQVEALYSGTPVIASDLPGVRVPIKTTGFGTIVDPREGDMQDQELANAIDIVLKRRYDRALIRKQSLEKLKSAFKDSDIPL